jgi:hypothetical protein
VRRLCFLASLALCGCMGASPPPGSAPSAAPPQVDSVTVALWRMDEPAGTRVADSGPFRLDGTTGRQTLRTFGRFRGALGFERSLDSFVYVPHNPTMESSGGLTLEAWIYPTELGAYEDTPLVARWTEEANRQSWIFSLAGRRLPVGVVAPGPGYHRTVFPDARAGCLLFAYQPETAGPSRGFVSTEPIELGRWTHVAVTFDSEVVRFWVDGELDSQFASRGSIRASSAPLLVGNYFDVRLLTRFGGDLRPDTGDPNPYYAFQGRIDELRLSSVARADFPQLVPR